MSGGGRMAAGWGGAWRPSLRACTPGREREKKNPPTLTSFLSLHPQNRRPRSRRQRPTAVRAARRPTRRPASTRARPELPACGRGARGREDTAPRPLERERDHPPPFFFLPPRAPGCAGRCAASPFPIRFFQRVFSLSVNMFFECVCVVRGVCVRASARARSRPFPIKNK